MADLKGRILAGKILIEPIAAEEKTIGGIIIPDSAKEKPQQGKVILVGLDKEDEPMEVKVGDLVSYGKYAGVELIVDGTTFLLMPQSDVLYIA